MNPLELLKSGKITPYSILELNAYQGKSIDFQTLCYVYCNLAEKHHPDLLNNNHSKQEINEAQLTFNTMALAFSILKDPTSKQYYDQYGDISIDGMFNGSEDSWTSYAKGLWTGVKSNMENKQTSLSQIAQHYGAKNLSSLNNVGYPAFYRRSTNPCGITNIKNSGSSADRAFSGTNRPQISDSTMEARNDSRLPLKSTLNTDSSCTKKNKKTNKKRVKQHQQHHSFTPHGSAGQFSDSNTSNNDANIRILQQKYRIPNEMMYDEDMDQETVYDESELEKEDAIMEESESESEEVEVSDSATINSEITPVDIEELERQTKERQIKRGKAFEKKHDHFIAMNNLGKRRQLPSEEEFTAIQNRLVKRQRKIHNKRASSKIY